ncbi:MAG TPA: GntR family transcriptional regulator [Gemmatimonadaceae bacterium]|nr:GntR family transcriptional regulator [Gemmatimonadaceae bacterium]
MTNPTSFARRRLVDEVIDHFRVEISSGRLTTGSRLPPEAKLTAQLGVSRTTLREAMVVLSHNGLVDVRQGDGTFVRSDNSTDRDDLAHRPVVELLEAQRPIILGLVRLAASRRTEQDATRLGQLATALEAAQDNDLVTDADTLESGLAAAAHSDLLAQLHRQISTALRAKTSARAASADSSATVYLARCARAIVDRDAESADRNARLWLAAQASSLAPEQIKLDYAAPDVRRGPRASHARRPDVSTGDR